jgi:hypothetical protein
MEEFRLVSRNCELPDALLIRSADERREFLLMVSHDIFARRNEAPIGGRIACVAHWADERGFQLVVTDSVS